MFDFETMAKGVASPKKGMFHRTMHEAIAAGNSDVARKLAISIYTARVAVFDMRWRAYNDKFRLVSGEPAILMYSPEKGTILVSRSYVANEPNTDFLADMMTEFGHGGI